MISILITLSFFSSYTIAFANNALEKSFASDHISPHSFDSLDKNHETHIDSPIILPFSSSEMSSDLTSSFSSIINMQIFTGLNK
jgi:hypothetical protein